MTKTIKIQCRDKTHWLEQRAKVITATEASSLFALNPYASAAKMFQNKRVPTFQENAFTRLGHVLEPAVIAAVNQVLGVSFKQAPEGLFYLHSDAPLGATPDAFGKSTLLECKSTSPTKFLDGWVEHPPLYYILQVHVQLLCTRKKTAYIACLPTNLTPTAINSPLPLKIFMIRYNQELAEAILQRVEYGFTCFQKDATYEHDRALNRRVKELLVETAEEVKW